MALPARNAVFSPSSLSRIPGMMDWRPVCCLLFSISSAAVFGMLSAIADTSGIPVPVVDKPLAAPPAKDSHPRQANLLDNASLEEKDDTGRPRGWAVSPANIIVPAPHHEVAAPNGKRTLLLKSIKDSWGVLAQEIKLSAKDAGKVLFVSAQGRAPLNDYMYLSVECTIQGKKSEIKAPFPASPDSWKAVSVTLDLPKDVQPEKLKVRIIIRDDPGYVFRVDDLYACVM